VSGRAIAAGQTVLMKTMHGYRKFFNPNQTHVEHIGLSISNYVSHINIGHTL